MLNICFKVYRSRCSGHFQRYFRYAKYKTLKVKTNKKGILSLNTKKLSRANHKITIILNNMGYAINKSIKVKIK